MSKDAHEKETFAQLRQLLLSAQQHRQVAADGNAATPLGFGSDLPVQTKRGHVREVLVEDKGSGAGSAGAWPDAKQKMYQ